MLLEILTFATILATTLYFLLPRLLEQKGIFPGPKSHWLTGTPRSSAQTCFQNEEWVQEYGKVVSIFVGRKEAIIVGGFEAASILLEGEGGKTADRPRSVMAGETMSGNKRILLIRYGDRWRKLRKMLHQGLQPKIAATLEPTQALRARELILSIMTTPDQFANHTKTYAASVIMTFAYGKTTPTRWDDPDVKSVNRCLERLGQSVRPGTYLVDSFPILRYLPFGEWKSKGSAWHTEELGLFKRQLDIVREDVKMGRGVDCFARYLLEHQKEYGMDDDGAAYSAGSMFGAGADTTASAIQIVILASIFHPEAVRQVQQELDEKVGRERPPGFEDVGDLPLLDAFIKELYRWRPVSPAGFAHSTTEDIVYKDVMIPAGTIITGNHWSISHDTSVFSEDADEFIPERWFVDRKVELGVRKDLNHVQWGFGRRVCAGKNVAQRSVYINTAMLLWSFTMRHKKDSQGVDISIDNLAFTRSANWHPLPFFCEFTPRFEGVRKILESIDL